MKNINMAEMFTGDEIISSAASVLKGGHYINGNENKEFEKEFAKFCETDYSVTVNSGTNALILALASLKVGPGDEVIMPSHTFIATANAAMYLGAKPVFAEINGNNYTIDPDSAASLVTENTKVIIHVHIYGHPCDMDEINKIAGENGLKVIEDSCQAHGAEYKGRKAGSLGDIGAFSFFPSKNMTVAGDGGALTTDSEEIYSYSAAIRNQGRKPGEKYHHSYQGMNLRLSEVHAAIGRVQLRYLEDWNNRRRDNAAYYNDVLGEIDGIITPEEERWAKAVYHQYVIRVNDRDSLSEYLKERGISTGVHYPVPAHLQPFILEKYGKYELGITEKTCNKILSIPVHPWLTEEEREYITDNIAEYFRK